MPPDSGAQVRELGMDVNTMWYPRSHDLPDTKAAIEAIEIIFPPAASSASHLLQ
jgi:hypothetical protein